MFILYYLLILEFFVDQSFSAYISNFNIYSTLDFLGIGYNAVLAFPFGTEDTNLDPGFMSPLVQFTFIDTINSVDLEIFSDNTSKMIVPDGVWIRRDYACRENKMSKILDSDKALKSVISEDVTNSLVLGPIGFVNNSEFKKLEQMIKNENYTTLIYKSQCASTSMGLILTREWLLADSFKSAINKLPGVFKGFDSDFACKYDSYVEFDNQICAIWIKPWLDFFSEFGTHIISRLVLGGKLIHIVNKKVENISNKIKKSDSNDTNVDLSVATANLSYNTDNHDVDGSRSDENKDLYYVTGGNAGIIFNGRDNFKEWSKTVHDNQMPIKIDITPLSELLPSAKLKLDYWKALKYYKLFIENKMK